MRKYLAGLWLLILVVTAFTVSPAAAAPNLAGTWNLTGTLITPNGGPSTSFTVDMTLTRSDNDPSLYSGIFGNKPEQEQDVITLQQDAGANVHFAISSPSEPISGSLTGYVATLQGRGTASTKNFTGTFGTIWGEIGTLKGTKQK